LIAPSRCAAATGTMKSPHTSASPHTCTARPQHSTTQHELHRCVRQQGRLCANPTTLNMKHRPRECTKSRHSAVCRLFLDVLLPDNQQAPLDWVHPASCVTPPALLADTLRLQTSAAVCPRLLA
jgi:hypothetical protein